MTNEEVKVTDEELKSSGTAQDEGDEVDFDTPLLQQAESDEEELWPGGPTVGHAKAWQEEYGKLYMTSIDADTHIIWRPISRFEYKNHIKRMEALNAQRQLSQADATFKSEESLAAIGMICPLFNPQAPDDGLAGVPSLIASQIMDASGFVAMAVREL